MRRWHWYLTRLRFWRLVHAVIGHRPHFVTPTHNRHCDPCNLCRGCDGPSSR